MNAGGYRKGYDGVGARDLVAQPNSCRMSAVGVLSAACLGSTSRLRSISVDRTARKMENKPSTVQVLEVPVMPRVFKGAGQVFLNLRYAP